MKSAKDSGGKATGDGAKAPPQSSPTLREAAAAAATERSDRLQSIVDKHPTVSPAAKDDGPAAGGGNASAAGDASGNAAGGIAAPPAATASEDDYETWFKAQPEKHRAQFAENVIRWQAQELDKHYGPEVAKILESVNDNPKLKAVVAKLTDKQLVEWLADEAIRIYDDPQYQPSASSAPAPQITALERQFGEIKETVERDRAERALGEYKATRQTEYAALFNTYPELRFEKFDDPKAKYLAHIIELAEEESRRTGRMVSYADVYERDKQIHAWREQNPPPRVAPATSDTEIPNPQAPRTKVEAKNAMTRQLEQFGGISRMAHALRG